MHSDLFALTDFPAEDSFTNNPHLQTCCSASLSPTNEEHALNASLRVANTARASFRSNPRSDESTTRRFVALDICGVFTRVRAKHSKSFSLMDCISVGVDRMQQRSLPALPLWPEHGTPGRRGPRHFFVI